jgi:hypothetical protein
MVKKLNINWLKNKTYSLLVSFNFAAVAKKVL